MRLKKIESIEKGRKNAKALKRQDVPTIIGAINYS
jgi:hypothetical protein